jgi:hypothetical protein
MLASLGHRWWQHIIVTTLHEHSSSTKIVLVHGTQLCSSDPTITFTLCRRHIANTMNKDGILTFCNLSTVTRFFPLCQLYVTFSQLCSFDKVAVAIIERHRH